MSRHVSTEPMTGIQKTIHSRRRHTAGLCADPNAEGDEHFQVVVTPTACRHLNHNHPSNCHAFTTFQREMIDLQINRRIDHQPGHEPSLRVQSLLDLVQVVLADLVEELRKQYSVVEVKLSVVAE